MANPITTNAFEAADIARNPPAIFAAATEKTLPDVAVAAVVTCVCAARRREAAAASTSCAFISLVAAVAFCFTVVACSNIRFAVAVDAFAASTALVASISSAAANLAAFATLIYPAEKAFSGAITEVITPTT